MKPKVMPAVKSASRVLRSLESLGESKQPLSFLELSRDLKIPKSSLFHLLADLTARGYVERMPDISRTRSARRSGAWFKEREASNRSPIWSHPCYAD